MAAIYHINESDPFSRLSSAVPQQASLIYTPRPFKVGSIELEVAALETHTATSEPTQNPIESGANITDHVRQNPDEVTLEAVVSDATLDKDGGSTKENYSQRVYEELLAIKEKGEAVTLVTSLRNYENMVMTRLVVPRDVNRMNAVYVSMTFKQIKTATLQTAPAPKVAKANKPKNNGKKPTKTTRKQDKSMFAKALDAFKWNGAR
jgi:hypothetical protein